MNHITKGVLTAKVGHELDPCTQFPQAFLISRANFPSSLQKTLPAKLKRLVVIDTPGFEDTNRSDAEIVDLFIQWFTTQ